ncbi:hypothetical protein AS200_44920 (plasmid) [Streptomyces sp. CdTB01]|nr:hypothetical protein AS200_44920 [Streptomyces sp. CdTB01]
MSSRTLAGLRRVRQTAGRSLRTSSVGWPSGAGSRSPGIPLPAVMRAVRSPVGVRKPRSANLRRAVFVARKARKSAAMLFFAGVGLVLACIRVEDRLARSTDRHECR